MHKRATSKKLAAEAEKGTRMEEKEATSAEDVEEILTTVELRQPEQVEEIYQPEVNQPEKPTKTGDVNYQEMMRMIIEGNNLSLIHI